MKNKIFMYLFIFTLLILLFQFMSSKQIFDDSNKKVASYKAQTEKYKDSIVKLNNKINDLALFDIEWNDPALSYFEDSGYNVSQLLPLIKDGLYQQNETKGQHPLIPYASSEGNRMQINSIRILNHKWIICNFTDGEFSGELFIKYFIDDNSQLEYIVEDSFLYRM